MILRSQAPCRLSRRATAAVALLWLLALPAWSVGQEGAPKDEARPAEVKKAQEDVRSLQADLAKVREATEAQAARAADEAKRAAAADEAEKAAAENATKEDDDRESRVKEARERVERVTKELAERRAQFDAEAREAEAQLREAQAKMRAQLRAGEARFREANEQLRREVARLRELEGGRNTAEIRALRRYQSQLASPRSRERAPDRDVSRLSGERSGPTGDLERRLSDLEKKFDQLLEEVRGLRRERPSRPSGEGQRR